MNKNIWMLLTFLSGAFLPIQAGLNAKLGKAGGSPIHASMISFVIGTVILVGYILFTRQTVSWVGLRATPAYAWAGGLIGAYYVTIILLAYPQLGPALTFSLVIAGQLIFSIVLEHFQILVADRNPINWWKIFGVLLIVVGGVIIRRN